MHLAEIRSDYLEGKELSAINERYKTLLTSITDAQQLDIWTQVAAFANAEMIDYLLTLGWRAAGVEDNDGNSLLHILAASADAVYMPEGRIYETTKKLLLAKISPLRKNNQGETALILAAKNGYWQMIQAYAELDAKTNVTDRDGNTLLHIAAHYSAHTVDALDTASQQVQASYNDTRFDPNSQRDMQRRARLEWQYQAQQVKLNNFITFVLLCMEFGADPYQQNNTGETAIDTAIRYRSKIIGAILNGVDLNNAETAPLYMQAGGMDIFQACMQHDLLAIEALIKLGEDLNGAYDMEGHRYQGMTPLSICMVQQQAGSIDLLLKNGADPMLADSKSWHPFRYLYTPIGNINNDMRLFQNKTMQQILQAFIHAGFDGNALLDDEENTLLTLSAKYAPSQTLYNGQSVAKVLINELVYHNVALDKTNRAGITALMYLCGADAARGEREILTLLEQGASTELKDKDGKTALIYAAANPDKSVAKTYCELLASFGNVWVLAKDNAGKSALDYAADNNNQPLVNWLLEQQ
jgi:ankyrin repeat protein